MEKPKYVLVWELHNEGLSVQEIAERLGLSTSAVRKHLRYAQRKFASGQQRVKSEDSLADALKRIEERLERLEKMVQMRFQEINALKQEIKNLRMIVDTLRKPIAVPMLDVDVDAISQEVAVRRNVVKLLGDYITVALRAVEGIEDQRRRSEALKKLRIKELGLFRPGYRITIGATYAIEVKVVNGKPQEPRLVFVGGWSGSGKEKSPEEIPISELRRLAKKLQPWAADIAVAPIPNEYKRKLAKILKDIADTLRSAK